VDWWLVVEPGTDRTGWWTPLVKVVEERFTSQVVRGVIRNAAS
jgi:hypothetical protein